MPRRRERREGQLPRTPLFESSLAPQLNIPNAECLNFYPTNLWWVPTVPNSWNSLPAPHSCPAHPGTESAAKRVIAASAPDVFPDSLLLLSSNWTWDFRFDFTLLDPAHLVISSLCFCFLDFNFPFNWLDSSTSLTNWPFLSHTILEENSLDKSG